MVVRNSRGQVRGSVRRINTRLSAELLVGDGWEGVAYAEIMRLSLEVGAYHSQLENKPGYEETGQAITALKAACAALNAEYSSDEDNEGGLELRLQPDR
jgi:hypothetical protein